MAGRGKSGVFCSLSPGSAVCSLHTCVSRAIKDILTDMAGTLKPGQEDLVTGGERCDSLPAVLTLNLREQQSSFE